MEGDIIFTCRSKNNKNVRKNELKILRKNQGDLFFEFGESEMNIKKRYYDDEKTLEKDFKELTELKKDLDKRNSMKDESIKTDNERKSIISKRQDFGKID